MIFLLDKLLKMKNVILVNCLLLLMSVQSIAQDLTLPELEGFKKSTNYPVYVPDNLWDFINGAADNFLSYEFINLHVAEYKKGKNSIKLEVYKHNNSTMAFGIYSSERSPSFRFINLGTQGYEIDGAINFFKGNYYIKIRTYSTNPKIIQSAEKLSLKVANMLEGDTKMPSIISQFPETGKKANDETYINESVLGHKFLGKAFKANYETSSGAFSIFILENNSASDAMKAVNEYLKTTGNEISDQEGGRYVVKDGYNGVVFIAWKEDRIVLVTGLSKDQSDIADSYISEIIK
jgi:hypothetical protein